MCALRYLLQHYKEMYVWQSHTHMHTIFRLSPLVREKGNHMQPVFISSEFCHPPRISSLSSKALSPPVVHNSPRQLIPKLCDSHCKNLLPSTPKVTPLDICILFWIEIAYISTM